MMKIPFFDSKGDVKYVQVVDPQDISSSNDVAVSDSDLFLQVKDKTDNDAIVAFLQKFHSRKAEQHVTDLFYKELFMQNVGIDGTLTVDDTIREVKRLMTANCRPVGGYDLPEAIIPSKSSLLFNGKEMMSIVDMSDCIGLDFCISVLDFKDKIFHSKERMSLYLEGDTLSSSFTGSPGMGVSDDCGMAFEEIFKGYGGPVKEVLSWYTLPVMSSDGWFPPMQIFVNSNS